MAGILGVLLPDNYLAILGLVFLFFGQELETMRSLPEIRSRIRRILGFEAVIDSLNPWSRLSRIMPKVMLVLRPIVGNLYLGLISIFMLFIEQILHTS